MILRCVFLVFIDVFIVVQGFSVDLSGRITKPTCVDIPPDLSLCQNIGYNQMRMPNLLDHDTMSEVKHQAQSWVPLLLQRCHEDTQLFLCSLFAPVCLDRPIFPCRSLCEAVKSGCLGIMQQNCFEWPEMLQCDKFPLDNDLCIQSIERNTTDSGEFNLQPGKLWYDNCLQFPLKLGSRVLVQICNICGVLNHRYPPRSSR